MTTPRELDNGMPEKSSSFDIVVDPFSISPLPEVIDTQRLVQAIFVMESGFPASSSHDTALWQAFWVTQHRHRAATMFQSTFRMYATLKRFRMRRSRLELVTADFLRGQYRKLQQLSRTKLLLAPTWADALNAASLQYNTTALHRDFCSRIARTWTDLARAPTAPLSPLRGSFEGVSWNNVAQFRHPDGPSEGRYAHVASGGDGGHVAVVPRRYGSGEDNADEDSSEHATSRRASSTVHETLPGAPTGTSDARGHSPISTGDVVPPGAIDAALDGSLAARRGLRPLQVTHHADDGLRGPPSVTPQNRGVDTFSPQHTPALRASKPSLAELARPNALPLPPTPMFPLARPSAKEDAASDT